MEDRIIQVFCAICKARNDATFDYCLHCRTPPLWGPIALPTRRAVGIVIDESRLAARKAAVALATSHNAGQKRKLRVSDKFDAFISARSTQARGWASATNQDVLDGLCWLDSHDGGTKAVHSPNCAAVGPESLERCSPGSSCDFALRRTKPSTRGSRANSSACSRKSSRFPNRGTIRGREATP